MPAVATHSFVSGGPRAASPMPSQPWATKHLVVTISAIALSILSVVFVVGDGMQALVRRGGAGPGADLKPSYLRIRSVKQSVEPLGSPREHAIIVPYRNRSYHLVRFKEYMGPYLLRNFPNDVFSLWTIEQGDDALFNRGWLANVGIAEATSEHTRWECIIFHDVDLIPERDGVPYNECTLPTRLGSELEHFDWGIPYSTYFGGVVNMHMEHWRLINGFSNDYQGWGGEDDDLYERIRINGLLDNNAVHRPPPGHGRFKTISQSSEHHPKGVIGKEQYEHSLEILGEMRNNSRRWKTDGLSDLHYTVLNHTVDKSQAGFLYLNHVTCIP